MAPKKRKKKQGRKHPWRENIETLTGAIVLALIFKAFLVEISRIPSPSMQPTLMGLQVQSGDGFSWERPISPWGTRPLPWLTFAARSFLASTSPRS